MIRGWVPWILAKWWARRLAPLGVSVHGKRRRAVRMDNDAVVVWWPAGEEEAKDGEA